MIYGNRFKDINNKNIDVIISTDKNDPAFRYETLDAVADSMHYIDLSMDEPVMIEQASEDGLFSPIKSLAATIRFKSHTPLFDLYQADSHTVSVKIIKHDVMGSQVTSISTSDTEDSSSTTTTSTTTVSPNVEAEEEHTYSYDEHIVFTEQNETVHVGYPTNWDIVEISYDHEDFTISNDGTTITALRQNTSSVVIMYRYVEDYYSTTTTTTPDPTISTTTTTTLPPDAWPTYSYTLDIDATGIPASSRSRKADTFGVYNTEDPFRLLNTTNHSLFMGYVTPAEYNQEYNIYDTIEIECVDAISSLQYMPFDLGRDQILSWITLIGTALKRMGGYQAFLLPTSYDFNTETQGLDYIYQNINNFYDDDEEQTPWKWYDVLSEFCRTFGLSAIPYDGVIIFLDYFNTSNSYSVYTNGSEYTGRYFATITFDQAGTISTDILYASEGAQCSLDQVYNKIAVKDSLFDQTTGADQDDASTDYVTLTNCNPNYSSSLQSYPFDVGYTYWREFCYARHETVNLYKFVRTKDIHFATPVSATYWQCNNSTYEMYYSKPSLNVLDLSLMYTTTGNTNLAFVKDQYIREQVIVHTTHGSASYNHDHYYGMEWSIPLKHSSYNWNSSDDRYDVPHSINWDDVLLMKCNKSGSVKNPYASSRIEPRTYPMLYETELKTDFLSWDANSRIVIDGSISLSDDPWFSDAVEHDQEGKVNAMIYIEGGDGKFYYRTYTYNEAIDKYIWGWTITDEKIDWTTKTFDFQQAFIVPITLDNDDSLKEGSWLRFKDEVDYGYRFANDASGMVINPVGAGVYSGCVHFIPMGFYNNPDKFTDYIWWKDLAIVVARRDDQQKFDSDDADDIVYTNVVNEDYVTEPDEIELKINTQPDNKPLSLSAILNKFNGNISYSTAFHYNDSQDTYRIEEILGNKYYAHYCQPKVIFDITIQGGLVVPFSTITESLMGIDMMVDAQTYDVQQNENELTLIQLDKSIVPQVFEQYNIKKISRNRYDRQEVG